MRLPKGRGTKGPMRPDERRRRLLYACIALSALLHMIFIFSFGPWWERRMPRPVRKRAKVVSLRIRPRRPRVAAPPKARPKAPAKPAPSRPVPRPKKAAPVTKPVYTTKELAKALAVVRSEAVSKRYARPKKVMIREAIGRQRMEARKWTEKEKRTLEKRIAREAAGLVGYSRIIDLTKSSDYQIGRLMDQYKIDLGYGSRKIRDFNIPFTSEWLFTPGQLRLLAGRRGRRDYREISDWIPRGKKSVALRESGEGKPRVYIAPTVDAVAAIVLAEDDYFRTSGEKPDELDALVFRPVWTYKGPAFEVVRAVKKKPKKRAAAGGAAVRKITGKEGGGR